ncbi:hypothetical protein A3J78_00615 [Candidatus Beckwithbacteria bacterium RBG_13_35_6]|uniref:Uncharacterized protein n=1 Tax=Candidatus Beckwithbacteria bacterium RBG_13_35_6 TaxID=1797456 RepID=A0A1F5DDR6_9BACT|nr:MAG: hypothetical protein A3J78_00615 [Candidatus Beckwithbacteria bacterium RBG_13_35_6]
MKKVLTKTIIFLGYFAGLFLLSRISSLSLSLSFFSSFAIDLTLWFVGAMVGVHFIKLDQLFYVYITRPTESFSLEVKRLVAEKKLSKVWNLLDEKVLEQPELASRSFLFQIGWFVLAVFTVTSYAGLFGQALVLGIGLKLLLEEWESYLSINNFSWAFWQIKREVGVPEQKTYLYIMTGLFLILTLLII